VGSEDPVPYVVDPDSVALAVAPFMAWCEGVEVGAEPVFAALEDLNITGVVVSIDDVAFR
jgi:hypothetical protein